MTRVGSNRARCRSRLLKGALRLRCRGSVYHDGLHGAPSAERWVHWSE